MTMKRKRATRKSPLPMVSPLSPTPPPISPTHSPPPPRSSTRKDSIKSKSYYKSPEPASRTKTLTTVSDFRDLYSSRLRDIKSNLIDRSHSEIFNDLDSSRSRLHKRLKIQTQACEQVMDDAEKEYKKMSERVEEGYEAMKESYREFMADVQATNARVWKSTIPDLSKSFEKAVSVLKGRFGISSA